MIHIQLEKSPDELLPGNRKPEHTLFLYSIFLLSVFIAFYTGYYTSSVPVLS